MVAAESVGGETGPAHSSTNKSLVTPDHDSRARGIQGWI